MSADPTRCPACGGAGEHDHGPPVGVHRCELCEGRGWLTRRQHAVYRSLLEDDLAELPLYAGMEAKTA